MLKKSYLSFLVIIFWWIQVSAQNLVPNSSFEQYTMCPPTLSGISYSPLYNTFLTAHYWVSPLQNTSPDYYNRCAGASSAAGIPKNTFGFKETRAGGDAYAGMIAWEGQYVNSTQINDYREYIETELRDPLVAGHNYCVIFYVSPSISPDFNFNYVAIDQIGVKFSNAQINNSTNYVLSMIPDVMNATGNYIVDTAKWYKIKGTYMAHGGEKWLTLGSFSVNNSLPSYQQIYPANPLNATSFRTYLYVDDVSVSEISTHDSIITVHDTSICFTQNIYTCSVSGGADEYLWNNGNTTNTQTITAAGTYWCRAVRGCSTFTDSFRVANGANLPLAIKGDTVNCSGLPVVLKTTAHFNSYSWSTGAISDSVMVFSSGPVSVSVNDGCGVKTTSVNVTIQSTVEPPIVKDTTVCQFADNIHLPVSGTNLNWYFYPAELHARHEQPVVYTGKSDLLVYYVSCTVGYCESVRVPISVKVMLQPSITLSDNYHFCEKEVKMIGSTYPDVTYKWSTGYDGCCFTPDASGYYTFTIYNNCGISSKSTYVEIDPCNDCIGVPTVFTPDNDGYNDVFRLSVQCPLSSYLLCIYNRWGNKVFSSKDASEAWAGKINGSDAVAEVYIYTLEYTTSQGKHYSKKGNLTLLR